MTLLRSPRSIRDWLPGFFGLAALLVATSAAQAGLTFKLQIYRYNGEYVFYTPMFTNATGPAAPLGTYIVTSPSHPTNGAWRQFEMTASGLNEIGGGGYGYSSFTSMIQQVTNGDWSIVVTNATTTNHYKFSINASGMTSNLLPANLITYPAPGESVPTNRPTFAWQPPNWPVFSTTLAYGNNSFFQGTSLPASQNSWTIPVAMPVHTNYTLYVQYLTNNTAPIIVAATPLSTNLAQPISGWSSTSTFEATALVNFEIVAPSGSGGHTNVAHYTFDNNDITPQDVSGHGNHIVTTSSSGDGSVDITADSLAGDYAAEFYNDDNNGAGWLNAPASLLTTLEGSFSVSLWLKTSGGHGDDNDNVFDADGIVSALNGGSGNEVVPIGLTGSKLIFYTGGSPQHTLRSSTSVDTDEYIHVVVTRDQSTGVKKIYIDGELDVTGTGTTDLLEGPTNLDIGYNNGHGFNGKMDDIQFYSGVLSESEVFALYDDPGSVVPDVSGDALGGAVDNPSLTWLTGGAANWFAQTDTTHDDVDAAQSGAIDDDEESWIKTTVTGPGTLSFFWNVDSEDGGDYLEFQIDGNYQNDISGDWGWDFQTYEIPPGSHTLRWVYYKDGCCIEGEDAAYLDEVTYTPAVSPTITQHPFSQTNRPGYPVALIASATGTPEPAWQWYKGGVLIAGATRSFYSPTNSGTAGAAGNYHAIASNSAGSANTHTAAVTFVSASLPPDWTRAFGSQLLNDFTTPTTNYGIACLQDAAGNIYSANSFTGTNYFDTNILGSPGYRFSAALLKFTPTGAPIWGRGLTNNGNGNAYPQCLATAPGDGVYMSGVFFGTNWLGTNVVTETAGASVYLARFDSSGGVVWVRKMSGTNSVFQSYHQLTADASGNVTISFLGQNTFSVGSSNVTVVGQKPILAQFDASGNLRWVQFPSGWLQGMASSAGRIYAAMNAGETNYIGGLTNTSDRHWALVALNATNGQAAWIRGMASALGDGILGDTPRVAVSGTNVFVVGTGTGANATFGPYTVTWPGVSGQYFARYDTDGTAQLATAFGSETTMPWAAVADAAGNVYVGGDFDNYSVFGENFLAGPHLSAIGSGFLSQTFVAKFDRNGNSLWARQALSPSSYVNLRDLALASDGVWAGGFVSESAAYGTNSVYGTPTCIGSPFCFLQYYINGSLAKITDAVSGPPTVTLLNPQVTGANFQFSFQSQSGLTYYVISRTNVASGTWQTNATIAGDGSLKTVTIPKTNVQRYFRIGAP